MGNFSFKNHIFHHISGTTGPIGLKFLVRADFGHPVAHTKLQPLRLKDAEDIGWCVRIAGGARGLQRTVRLVTFFQSIFYRPLFVFSPYLNGNGLLLQEQHTQQ